MIKKILDSRVFRYGVAIFLSIGIIALKEYFRNYIGQGTPFILIFFAIILSAFIGGLGPGIVSVFICTLSIAYFFFPPYYSFVIAPQYSFSIIASLFEGLIIVLIIYYQKISARSLLEMNKTLENRVQERTKELQAFNIELERSNQELQDFAHIASHDLQEPLRKIQTFGNLLKTDHSASLQESGINYLERMNHAATRMRVLIDDLLSFSRVTSKAHPFIEVDLNHIIRDVLIDLEVRVKDLNAVIEVKKLMKVQADPSQMRQLFQNIISNCLKFHKEGVKPIIFIACQFTTQKNHDNLLIPLGTNVREITIKDNGIGFDQKYSEKIFNIFERLHSRQEYQGTGIGLAISKKIVDRHGWYIRAESQPDIGTSFIITIPNKN